MLTTAEAEVASDAIERKGVSFIEYHTKLNAVYAQWAAWLAVEYAYGLPEGIFSGLFERAWEDGHSSGLTSVENYYQEYADFARKVVEAARS